MSQPTTFRGAPCGCKDPDTEALIVHNPAPRLKEPQ